MEILLGLLLARAGQVVSTDAIIMELWGAKVPRRVTASLHVYISELRKFLVLPDIVLTRSPGYVLQLGAPMDLDAHEFLGLLEAGRTALRGERHGEAADALARGLALWRGPALGGMRAGPILEGFVRMLADARLECRELRMQAQLNLGRHRELVGPLYSLISEQPLHEESYRLLMLALYRSGRQAEALDVYRSARRTFTEDLGLEPTPALQDLQRRILEGDPGLHDGLLRELTPI